MSTANKIFLGSVHRNNPEQLERRCSVAVKSGMLAVTTGAFPGTFIPHATAGANPGFRYVVKEPILGPVDYTYTVTTETVYAYNPHSGEIYQMRMVNAAYTLDQALTSNGDGTLKGRTALPISSLPTVTRRSPPPPARRSCASNSAKGPPI